MAGTQIGPGTRGADIGGFGYGADAVSDHAYASAGGGGLWGGNTGVHYWSGGGGSGYIGGVTNGKTLRGGFTLDEYGNVVLDDNRMPVPNGEEGYIPSGTADGKARITYLGAV